MKKLLIAFLVIFCLFGISGMASAAYIDANYNSHGGSVSTFINTKDASSSFYGEGYFTGNFRADTEYCPKYNSAPWAAARDTYVIDTELHVASKGAKGAKFNYHGYQEFQKGITKNANQAAVALLSANGDRASMNVGFTNSENRATIVGYDHQYIVKGQATYTKHDFGVSMNLFNVDAKKLNWNAPYTTTANNYVVSEGGQYQKWSEKGKGYVGLYKTKWGQSAVAATHGHTSAGSVDFYNNNNVVLDNNGVWQAYNDDFSEHMGASVANGLHFHANYELSG